MIDLDALDFAKGGGRVTVVAQDAETGVVLMVAQADREALERTIATGEMHYTSRTRGLWHKGATSGNRQRVVSMSADCDGDVVLARVRPLGPACHLGMVSCFGDVALASDAVAAVDRTIAARATEGEGEGEGEGAEIGSKPSYTRQLLGNRNLRLKKLGEEAAELVVALAEDDGTQATQEAADLVYHMLVALRAVGVGLSGVQRALAERAR